MSVTRVVMNTSIQRHKVIYEVLLEEDDGCSRCGTPQAGVVWRREVRFGKDPAHRAGGDAFKWAAREQEEFAHKLACNGLVIESIPFEGVLTE